MADTNNKNYSGSKFNYITAQNKKNMWGFR